MKWVFKELFNKPREWHAYSIAVIITYLGLVHQPFVQMTGSPFALHLAFGIGLVIIGVRPKVVRDVLNRRLPEKARLPDDIVKEPFYYWAGIFTVYAARHVWNFFLV